MSALSTVDLSTGICHRPPEGMTIDDWYPKSKKDRYSEAAEMARSNCRVCSAKADCLSSALEAGAAGIEIGGILGGLDQWEREAMITRGGQG